METYKDTHLASINSALGALEGSTDDQDKARGRILQRQRDDIILWYSTQDKYLSQLRDGSPLIMWLQQQLDPSAHINDIVSMDDITTGEEAEEDDWEELEEEEREEDEEELVEEEADQLQVSDLEMFGSFEGPIDEASDDDYDSESEEPLIE